MVLSKYLESDMSGIQHYNRTNNQQQNSQQPRYYNKCNKIIVLIVANR